MLVLFTTKTKFPPFFFSYFFLTQLGKMFDLGHKPGDWHIFPVNRKVSDREDYMYAFCSFKDEIICNFCSSTDENQFHDSI